MSPERHPTRPASRGTAAWRADLKAQIRATRLRAALAATRALIGLSWQIGRDIHERQAAHGWGADLRAAFPDSRGFSSANLRDMRAFAAAWPDPALRQRVVGKWPWDQTIARAVKDPYAFDFLTLRQAAHERGVERAPIARVKDLLLELGKGFSVLASQHHLAVCGQDFCVDRLFYHRKLRCLIAVDPKTGPFQPEHAGKMNFCLAALDDRDREPGDTPSIGLILCRERNRVVVEHALRGVDAPIGAARYELMPADALPAQLARRSPQPRSSSPACCPPPEATMREGPSRHATCLLSPRRTPRATGRTLFRRPVGTSRPAAPGLAPPLSRRP